MRALPPVIEMIRDVVARASVSSTDPRFDQSNRSVIELIAGWAEDLGFDVALEELPNRPGKWNLIASIEPTERGPSTGGLVLSGHTDTVPFDADRWTCDPFVVSVRNDALHGLGTADMKSFFALALHAVARVGRRHGPVHLLGTADEECTMDGARALLERGAPRAPRAIIGEPTGLKPVRMHKGVLMERVRLVGQSGHSSDPALGVNAIDAMRAVMASLDELRTELAERHRDEDFDVPIPTVSFGRIAGGDSPNRICGECTLDFDVRLVPSLPIDEVRELVHQRARSAARAWGVEVELTSLIPGTPALKTSSEAEVVRTAEALTGRPACAVGFCTEAPFLTELGMETLVLGAGDIAVAHQADEHIALAELEPAIDLYEQLVRRYAADPADRVAGERSSGESE